MRVLLFTLAACLPALAQQDVPEYWSNLGLMQYESHEYAQAEKALRRSLGMNKSLFVPNLFLGLDLLELKRPQEAVGYLLAAQKLNPRDVQVPLALGRAFHILFDPARSREWYQRAADLAPRNGDAWYAVGIAYLDLAESASAKLLAEFPSSRYIAELKAEARHSGGADNVVICEHPEPPEKHPNDAEGWYRSVKTYQELGISALACASEVAPESPRMHALLGDAYQQRRMFREAEDEYSKILALEPDNLGGLAGLAAAYLHDGHFDQARAAAQKALTRDPADSEINLLMGEILVAQKEYAQAEPYLEHGLHARQDLLPRAHALLGRVYARTGHTKEAISELNQGLASDDDGSVYYQLARLYQSSGDEKAAAEAFEKSEQIRARRDTHISLNP